MEIDKSIDLKENFFLKKRSTLSQRITSRIWEFNELDPYQIFKVIHKKCLLLRVQIYHGKNISRGWRSLYIVKPSPYLILDMKGTPNEKKKTPVVKFSCSPEWNVCFQFLVDPSMMHDLHITLMDQNLIFDRKIGTKVFKLNKMKLDDEVNFIIEFQEGSEVYIAFSLVKSHKQDLRYSLSLSREEITFVKKRRLMIFEGMKRFLGLEDAPKEIREVPIVAIINSGGGIRAVVASSGVHKALHESGLLDCAMYVAGLSGSSWYLTYLYTHPGFPEDVGPGDLIPEIREKIAMDWKRLLSFKNVYIYLRHLMKKASKGQSISFTDFYGHLLGEMLLGERKNLKLSGVKDKLVMGTAPMPLFTCIIAKKNVSARIFQEYVEFSPYEVGLPKYGAFMKTETFGSKFYVGKIIKHYDELPFHYLIGIWGSAFTILFKRLIDEEKQAMKLMHGGPQNTTKNEEGMFYEDDTEENFADSQGEEGIAPSELINILEEKISRIENYTDGCSTENLDVNIKHNEIKKFEKYKSDSCITSDSTESSSKTITPAKRVIFQNIFHKRQKKENTKTRVKPADDLKKQATEIHLKDKKGPNIQTRTTDVDGRSSSESDSSDILYLNRDHKRRRTYYQDVRTSHKASEAHSGFWYNLIERITNIKCIGGTRAGRAGIIFNPLHALGLNHSYPISPKFETDTDGTDFQGTEEPIEACAKTLCLVDAGLAFNSPFPLLLRPQRAVDVFLSFDYSSRPADFHEAFGELILAEKWAIKNNVTFPPVEKLVKKYYNEPMREIYVFKHPDNPYCPILVHCIIFNGIFREYKLPDIKRETSEEFQFADFRIFSDPENPYSSLKYTYTPLQFDRLCKLMEFNTLYGMKIFKKVLKYAVRRKKKLLEGPPPTPSSEFSFFKK